MVNERMNELKLLFSSLPTVNSLVLHSLWSLMMIAVAGQFPPRLLGPFSSTSTPLPSRSRFLREGELVKLGYES